MFDSFKLFALAALFLFTLWTLWQYLKRPEMRVAAQIMGLGYMLVTSIFLLLAFVITSGEGMTEAHRVADLLVLVFVLLSAVCILGPPVRRIS